MKINKLIILLISAGLFTFFSCSTTQNRTEEDSSFSIAFGSCSHQWEPQPIFQEVAKNNPDLWIWLGDIIYADTEDMSKMKKDYDQQNANVDYKVLKSSSEVIGIWDDHDYGLNNSGKEYSKKDSSKLLLFDFLDVPFDSTVYSRPGAYQSYSYSQATLKVKVLLLDVRYFRDTLGTSQGSILGRKQWQWLISELTDSDADVHVLAGGIQFLPEDHRYEKWANFKTERTRLLQILDLTEAANPILLSGDRHFAEMSLVSLPNSKKPLLEITSSGLTHYYDGFTEEKNKHRVGQPVVELNFGMLKIEKKGRVVTYKAEIRNKTNKVRYSIEKEDLAKTLQERRREN